MQRILVYEYASGGGPIGRVDEAAALLPAGVAMRDALVADLLGVPGVTVTCAVCERPGAALPVVAPSDAARLSGVAARPGEPADAFLRRAARAHDLVWVVAPESCGILGRLREVVGAARWIGCDAEAIRIASSKRATVAALAAAGLVTPAAFGTGHRGGWVVKPDDGAGSLDVRVHPDRQAALDDLRQRERAGRLATIEPFVEGEALSVSVLAGAGAAEAIAFNLQRIEAGRDGLLVDLGVQCAALDARRDSRAAALAALARRVADALPGLRGFVGIDVVWHAGLGPVAIEVNPRVTCAYPRLSRKLGRNLAAEILALHGAAEACDA